MRRPFVVASILIAATVACARAGTEGATVDSSIGKIVVEELAGGLDHPWGMAFLPDGRLLVTERAGRLRLLSTDNKLSNPLAGVPAVHTEGQGGLLDVALDPDFATNHTIFLSFAEAGEGGASTALARATLGEGRLDNVTTIFRQEPKVSGGNHFGGRIVFSPQKQLFLTTGERFQFAPAQDLSTTLGKILRLNRDGSIPADNPFVGHANAMPAIWSYGHRNVQGAAFEPTTGVLWADEFGPAGGDELNRIERGKNYGWPLVSWGKHYDGREIPNPSTRPDFTDAVRHWNPVISPSGMIFYAGRMFPKWQGNIVIASLGTLGIVRLRLDGGKVAEEERIALGQRIRDIEQAPDGSLYVLTDDSDGAIWRLHPKS